MLKVSMTSWAICFQMNKPFLTKHVKKRKKNDAVLRRRTTEIAHQRA